MNHGNYRTFRLDNVIRTVTSELSSENRDNRGLFWNAARMKQYQIAHTTKHSWLVEFPDF